MSESESNSGIVLELAEEFLERYRQGQRPALKEYIDRHPNLADEIREVFPAMALMENIALVDEEVESQAPQVPEVPSLEQLGDYRILREVGRGGMGIVYEAEQVSLGRHVALKVLPRKTMVDATQKRRFEREARAAARLHHTNIVPIFGVGEHDGLPYYVMQFIQGLGLDEVLDELKRLQGVGNPTAATGGSLRASRKDVSAVDVARSLLTGAFEETMDVTSPAPESQAPDLLESTLVGKRSDSFTLSSSSVVLPGAGHSRKSKKQTYWQSVARIGLQVADALEYAHKQGILHRDIKPSNLLLDMQGRVWVTDFGLARAENEDHLTQTGDVVGTLRYLPPEAFDGRMDKRGDVYSLGLTLYELLAFQPAFEDRDRRRLIKRVTTEEAPRLDRLNPAIPRDLVTIVHKAIDREVSRRYASATEFMADLQRFLDDQPIQARRASATERSWRWCRRNPMVAGLTAALALVFLLGFAGVTWKWQEANREKENAQASQRGEAAQREIAERQAGIATREAALSRRMLYASDMNLAQQALQAGDTGRARALLDRQRPQAGQKDLRGFEWRYLWPLCQDASQLTLAGHMGRDHPNGSLAIAFSPDGRTLATSGLDYCIRIWDMGSLRQTKLLGIGGVPWPLRQTAKPWLSLGSAAPFTCGTWPPTGNALACGIDPTLRKQPFRQTGSCWHPPVSMEVCNSGMSVPGGNSISVGDS